LLSERPDVALVPQRAAKQTQAAPVRKANLLRRLQRWVPTTEVACYCSGG